MCGRNKRIGMPKLIFINIKQLLTFKQLNYKCQLRVTLCYVYGYSTFYFVTETGTTKQCEGEIAAFGRGLFR